MNIKNSIFKFLVSLLGSLLIPPELLDVFVFNTLMVHLSSNTRVIKYKFKRSVFLHYSGSFTGTLIHLSNFQRR